MSVPDPVVHDPAAKMTLCAAIKLYANQTDRTIDFVPDEEILAVIEDLVQEAPYVFANSVMM